MQKEGTSDILQIWALYRELLLSFTLTALAPAPSIVSEQSKTRRVAAILAR
jgi:hypothetical protein